MKFTFNWLKDYLDTTASIEDICSELNKIGLEVEEVENQSEKLKKFNCVLVEECIMHPESDHLHICTVRINNNIEPITVICGAPNVRTGLKTILAPVDSTLPSGIEIKKAKVRGVESNGMLCSFKELSLSEESDKIIELEDSTELGTNIADIFGINDSLIDISITPNRNDCLGVYGIARDLASTGIGKLKKLENITINSTFKSTKTLKVSDKNCPCFKFREIRNVKNCQSPEWMKKRLQMVGINPKNALIDITNYVMLTFNKPLHCYDATKVSNGFNIMPAVVDEDFTDLFGNKYKMKGGETLICDDNKILCLAGIIGSQSSCTEDNTEDILLESAVFDTVNTAKTGRSLNIESDARYRFERGVDINITEFVLNFATDLIVKICGGEISDIIQYEDHDKNYDRKVEFDFNKISTLVGLDIPKDNVFNILDKLGYEYESKGDNLYIITIPTWKNNIVIAEDIIDDIIRIYGYDKLKDGNFLDQNVFEKVGNDFVKKCKEKLYQIRMKLVANNMTELLTYAFCNESDNAFFAKNTDNLKLINPIISDLSYMRQSLIPNILNIIGKNINRGFENFSLFEIGNTYNSNKPEDENHMLVGIRYGKDKIKDIYGKPKDFDVFDIKKDLFDVLSIFKINGEKMNISRNVPQYYHPNKSGTILMGKIVLGYFGELHPTINKHFGLKQKINVFELLLDNIPRKSILISAEKTAFKTNDLQTIERDLAFIFDKSIEVGNVIKDIYQSNKDLISDVKIFDIYSDEKMLDKKSVAFSISIQPIEKSLTKAELDSITDKIITLISTKYSGELRNY